jgi:hypothetical protein
MAHSVQITFACEDPSTMAEFWAAALGYIVQPPPPGFETWDDFADEMGIPEGKRNDISAVVDPDDVGPRLLFERWDGGEPNKRVHVDVNVVDEELTPEQREQRLAEERERLEALGATFHRNASGIAGETWIEMFDPEGNWFCVQ